MDPIHASTKFCTARKALRGEGRLDSQKREDAFESAASLYHPFAIEKWNGLRPSLTGIGSRASAAPVPGME